MTRSCVIASDVPPRYTARTKLTAITASSTSACDTAVDRIVRGALGSDSECPDVAQDVFLEIVRSAAKLKDLDVPRIMGFHRGRLHGAPGAPSRRRRRRWVLCDVEDNEELRYEPDTDAAEVAKRVNSALGKLPCEERKS